MLNAASKRYFNNLIIFPMATRGISDNCVLKINTITIKTSMKKE